MGFFQGRVAKTSNDGTGKKLSYKSYNAQGGDIFGSSYDVARALDPIDRVGNQFGFKDPIHGAAESIWTGITGSEQSNVSRVKFDNLNSDYSGSPAMLGKSFGLSTALMGLDPISATVVGLGGAISSANGKEPTQKSKYGEADFEKLYNTMSPEELDAVGKMTDKDQAAWLQKRQADIEAGKVGEYVDPNAPAKPPPAPDLTDAALAIARAQKRGVNDANGRRASFLSGP